MLSLSTRKLIIFFINFPSYLGIINYKVTLHRNQYKMKYLENCAHRLANYFDGINHIAFILYIYFRLFEQVFYLNPHLSTDIKLNLTLKWVYYALAYGFLLVYRLHQYLYEQELPQVLQCYLNFYSVYISESKTRDNSAPKEKKKPLCILLIAVVLISIQNVIINLKRPWEKQLWTALLDNPAKVPLLYRLPLIGIYVYFLFSICVSRVYFYVVKIV